MDALAGESIYVGGNYQDTLKFSKSLKLKKDGTGNIDAFITKIIDYSITRGRVKSGPYCAGDTIKIPYTKFGIFDSTNVFVAQLSDENGNFDKPFELGRYKSNKDGTIIGKLPLFQVVSSKLYRIRILSTSPKIQSYYRTDTLRLLIYSKDKANPGSAETICKGDSVKLNTFGGIKWTWSPKYNINNISLRQPIVWPMKDTLYRIVIAGSSGCGKPDTAFKQIFVRPYPKSNLQFTDTMLCENSLLKIPVKFSGGDSTYQWSWNFVNPDKSYFLMKKGSLKYTDTLFYTPSADSITSEKLAILLKDGCTSKTDTAFIIIRQRDRIQIANRIRYTVLCTGQPISYKAILSGGVPKYYQYQWKSLITNTLLSSSDSLIITTATTEKIQLTVNDGCVALGVTTAFTIKVKPPVKVSSNLTDTMLCFGKQLSYKANATGVDSTGYKYIWLLGDSMVSTASTFLLKTKDLMQAKGESKILTLITNDNCSVPNDTIKAKITVKPSPVANYSYDLACSRTPTKFQFIGTKPQNPITTTFNWNFNNESSSTDEKPSKLFSTYGTKKIILTLTSSNACTDTFKNDLYIKPQSKADFNVNDACETDSAIFVNSSQDANSYNWKFGDGNTLKIESPKHLYALKGQSITYTVTLVGIVPNGCSDSITKAVTINANPISDFSYTKTGTKLELKALQTNNTYFWKFGNSDIVNTTSTIYTHTITKPDQNKVCLKATNLAGCISQTCKDVTLSISTLEKQNDFKLYPNPNTGNFTIDFATHSGTVSLEIINQIGQNVYSKEFHQAQQTLI